VKAWLRSLVRWLEGGNWEAQEPDHWCGACAIGQRLEERLAPYTIAIVEQALDPDWFAAAFRRQPPPEREECPLTLDEEDLFDEIVRGL
jgi:hypothetical protein